MSILAHEPAPVQAYIPTTAEEYFETARALAAAGEDPGWLGFRADDPIETRDSGLWHFAAGITAGRRERARRIGRELGINGQFCERPESIHRRFDPDFIAGWQEGADEWADREAIRAEWAAEYEEECRARDDEEHNREAGGWLHTGHAA